jgi:hypothetical protein
MFTGLAAHTGMKDDSRAAPSGCTLVVWMFPR